MLVFRNVSLSCTKNRCLKDINLQIVSGENIVIPNWIAAYDVFFMAILGIQKSQISGEILFEGDKIPGKNKEALLKFRRRIGYVPAHNGLLRNLTVQENILLPLQIQENSDEKQIFERFEQLKDVFLKNIDCDSLASTLDIEKEKRVMLARAVAASPKLLLLNCPIMGLELDLKDDIGFLIYDAILCRKCLPKDSAVIMSTEYSSWKKLGDNADFRVFSLTERLENWI